MAGDSLGDRCWTYGFDPTDKDPPPELIEASRYKLDGLTIWEWDQTDMAAYWEARTALTYYRQGQDAARNVEQERAKMRAG